MQSKKFIEYKDEKFVYAANIAYSVPDEIIANLEPKHIMGLCNIHQKLGEKFLLKLSPMQISALSNEALASQFLCIAISAAAHSEWLQVMTKEQMKVLAFSTMIKVFNNFALENPKIIEKAWMSSIFIGSMPPYLKFYRDYEALQNKWFKALIQQFLGDDTQMPDKIYISLKNSTLSNFKDKINNLLKDLQIQECDDTQAKEIFTSICGFLPNIGGDLVDVVVDTFNLVETYESNVTYMYKSKITYTFDIILEDIANKLYNKHNNPKMSYDIRKQYRSHFWCKSFAEQPMDQLADLSMDIEKLRKILQNSGFKRMPKERIQHIVFHMLRVVCKNDPYNSEKFIDAYLEAWDAGLEFNKKELLAIQEYFKRSNSIDAFRFYGGKKGEAVKEMVKKIATKIYNKYYDGKYLNIPNTYVKYDISDCNTGNLSQHWGSKERWLSKFDISNVHPNSINTLKEFVNHYFSDKNIEGRKACEKTQKYMEYIKSQIDNMVIKNDNSIISFQQMIKAQEKLGWSKEHQR